MMKYFELSKLTYGDDESLLIKKQLDLKKNID